MSVGADQDPSGFYVVRCYVCNHKIGVTDDIDDTQDVCEKVRGLTVANLYDVQVMTPQGTWFTDMTTGSVYRAVERGRYLHRRGSAAQVIDRDGKWVPIHVSYA